MEEFNDVEIVQDWNAVFIVYAYTISFVASYSTVHLLDHTVWRTEEERKVTIIRCPLLSGAIILGFGAVWSMHFVGMGSVTLHDPLFGGGVVTCYNWPITIGSMLAAIVFIYMGLLVASKDVFAGQDRLENLKRILRNSYHVTHTKSTTALRYIQRTVLFYQLQYIVGGGSLAAVGAIIMHYTGMMALKGPFHVEWNYWYVAASVVIALVVCVVGFWIIFRLRWKAKDFWLRYISAAVLAFAICGLHFFGMLSVTYIADHSGSISDHQCKHLLGKDATDWSAHQQIIVGVSMIVPIIAVVVENYINQELILVYRQQLDPNFDNLLRTGSASADRNNERPTSSSKQQEQNPSQSDPTFNQITSQQRKSTASSLILPGNQTARTTTRRTSANKRVGSVHISGLFDHDGISGTSGDRSAMMSCEFTSPAESTTTATNERRNSTTTSSVHFSTIDDDQNDDGDLECARSNGNSNKMLSDSSTSSAPQDHPFDEEGSRKKKNPTIGSIETSRNEDTTGNHKTVVETGVDSGRGTGATTTAAPITIDMAGTVEAVR